MLTNTIIILLLHCVHYIAKLQQVGWGFLGILDLSIGTHQTMLAGHIYSVDCVAFSPNGSQLASVSYNSVYVWNTKTWTQDKIHGLNSSRQAKFLNDGRLILIHHWRGSKHYIDASMIKEVDPPGSLGLKTPPGKCVGEHVSIKKNQNLLFRN